MIRHHRPPGSPLPGVIVLGGSGFIGRALVRRLRREGADVFAPSAQEADLTQPDTVRRLAQRVPRGHVIVLASALTPERGRDRHALHANIAMAESVASLLETISVVHLIALSSDAVFAPDLDVVSEVSCRDPGDFYGLAHRVREQILVEASRLAATPTLVVRPTAVYGPEDTHNAYGPSRFLRSALGEGRILLFGDGEERRHHLYVEDLAELVVCALRQRSEGTLDVAPPEWVSFRELAGRVVALLPKTRVERVLRQVPVRHRRHAREALEAAFPALPWTPLDLGLRWTADVLAGPGGR